MKMKAVRFSALRGASRGLWQLALWLLPLLLLSVSCQPQEPTASPEAKRYDLKGKVVSVDKEKKEVTIAHDEVKGYMPAMTMPFKLKDDWAFDVLAKGSNVAATLVVDKDSYWLEGIVISMSGSDPAGAGQGDKASGPRAGDEVPDYALVNQDGKPTSIHQYRGKALLLTFIYTRCPLPEYCTLMSTNFAQINKALKASPEVRDRTKLLSVTIDPEYDTPKVLRSYGAAHTGEYADEKFAYWEFATGKPDEIRRLAEFFGLNYFEEKNQITHSLRTVLISPEGKVHKMYPGNDWNSADVFHDIQDLLGAGSQPQP